MLCHCAPLPTAAQMLLLFMLHTRERGNSMNVQLIFFFSLHALFLKKTMKNVRNVVISSP